MPIKISDRLRKVLDELEKATLTMIKGGEKSSDEIENQKPDGEDVINTPHKTTVF